jgi:hypothetical protein
MADDANKHRQTFLRIAQETCRRLFDDFGVSLRPLPDTQGTGGTPMAYGGVIEFAGKNVRGSVTLGSSVEPLGNTNPLGKTAADREWLAELTNQLMGRIKNQLLCYAVEVTFGTPVTLRGEHFVALEKRKQLPLTFQGAAGFIRVWLDVDFGKQFQMLDRPDPKLGGPDQGHIVLF